MRKKTVCTALILSLVLSMLAPCTYAEDYGVFDSMFKDTEVKKITKLCTSEGEIITMYASDGRTIDVPECYREEYHNVGWFDTAEDAQIITMYASDGRTIEIPQLHREAYRNVGWYNTPEDAMIITMYAMDGRTIEIPQIHREAYKNVGWYSDIAEVSVIMYDADGNEYSVFKDNIAREQGNGLTLDNKRSHRLMFSADGRFITVHKKDVEAYKGVGWYQAGSDIVDAARPMVCITFDDGPGKHTDRILSVLEKYNVRATFFVQGQYVSRYKDVLKRAVSLGSEIGNHTWNHARLTQTIGNQISSTNDAVYNATGVYPKIYRPPYGAYNASVLKSINMPAILWSVDTRDWETRNAAKTLESVKKNARNGSIILMHDIHEPTADSVEPVVKWLLMQGYQLVTVSELLDARIGGAVNGRTYSQAK